MVCRHCASFGKDGAFYCLAAHAAIRLHLYPDPIAGLCAADGQHRTFRDPGSRDVFFAEDQVGKACRRPMIDPPVPAGFRPGMEILVYLF